MPEIFNKENKEKQMKLSRAYEGALRRRITLEEKHDILNRIQNGEKCGTIWRKEYKNIYKSSTGFRDMLNTKSLDEEIELNGTLEPLSYAL